MTAAVVTAVYCSITKTTTTTTLVFFVFRLKCCNVTPVAMLYIATGGVAWQLYNNHGVPVDITTLIGEERNKSIDMNAYEEAKKMAQVSAVN